MLLAGEQQQLTCSQRAPVSNVFNYYNYLNLLNIHNVTSFFLMYMCKNTRALYGYFIVSSLLLWRKLCASSHTLNLEEYFICLFLF